jgi:hypothetical protein
MRSSHVVTALATVTAGLTAAAAWQRRTDRRLAAPAAAPVEAPTVPVPAAVAVAVPVTAPDQDGVVLPFVRRVVAAPAPEQPAAPARCGESGGRTKAGAPCAARATSNGRCHHHRLAA